MMKCMTCPKSAAWHRSQIEQLEQTIGPMAGLNFEQDHPEEEDEDFAAMPEPERDDLKDDPDGLSVEHHQTMGGHYGYDSTNCPDCRIAQIGTNGLVNLSAFGA
jgi:hypothetical protein